MKKIGNVNDLELFKEDFVYTVEAIHLLVSMDLLINQVVIDDGEIAFSITLDNVFDYKVSVNYGFNLYTTFRALYKLYNEGTEEEDNALQSAVFDILYQHLESVHR